MPRVTLRFYAELTTISLTSVKRELRSRLDEIR
jgi:hypothetical protein